MIRRLVLVGAAGAIIAAAVVVALTLRSRPHERLLSAATTIDVSAPAEVTAGDQVELVIDADVAGTVRLTAMTALVSTNVDVDVNGPTSVALPSEISELAGLLTVRVDSGVSTAHSAIRVLPGEPVEPLVPLVGPRTIVADGRDFTMAVLLPLDRLGNAIADGTEFTITARREAGDESTIDASSDAGIAAVRVPARTRAGRLELWAATPALSGPVATILEVPGQPAPFELETIESTYHADAFTLHELHTTQLRDVNDNILPDGVAVTFLMRGPLGERVATAPVVDGAARVWIESPATPGTVSVVASVGGTTSTSLDIDFASAIGEVPVTIETLDDATHRVVVGPVAATNGTYPPDGTVVEVNGRSVPLRTGVATLDLPITDSVQVEILGTRVEVET